MPVLVALDGALTGGIWMHEAYGTYLGMQAKGLSKQLVIWIFEHGMPSGANRAVEEMPFKVFLKYEILSGDYFWHVERSFKESCEVERC